MKTITINVTDFDGSQHVLTGTVGWQLMEVLRDAKMKIAAECGGACACATCHVYIDDEWMAKLPPRQTDERLMLNEAIGDTAQSRLSCQITLTEELDGLTLTVAPNP